MQDGKLFQGGQKKRLKDTFETSLKSFSINSDTRKAAAQGKLLGLQIFSKVQQHTKKLKRPAAKEKKTCEMEVSPKAKIPFPRCSRIFRVHSGLTNHLCTHRLT